jgi:hypothetical protein
MRRWVKGVSGRIPLPAGRGTAGPALPFAAGPHTHHPPTK